MGAPGNHLKLTLWPQWVPDGFPWSQHGAQRSQNRAQWSQNNTQWSQSCANMLQTLFHKLSQNQLAIVPPRSTGMGFEHTWGNGCTCTCTCTNTHTDQARWRFWGDSGYIYIYIYIYFRRIPLGGEHGVLKAPGPIIFVAIFADPADFAGTQGSIHCRMRSQNRHRA